MDRPTGETDGPLTRAKVDRALDWLAQQLEVDPPVCLAPPEPYQDATGQPIGNRLVLMSPRHIYDPELDVVWLT